MTDANINTSLGFTMTSPKKSNDYFKTSSFLCRKSHFNNHIIERELFELNPQYAMVRGYIIANTQPQRKLPFLNAIQVEFKSDWYKGLFRKTTAIKYLKHFIEFGLLVRLSERSSFYYVNPNFSHHLSVEQREEYGNSYQELFPKISITMP